MADSHFSSLKAQAETRFDNFPTNTSPLDGQYFFDNLNNRLAVYNSRLNQWFFAAFTTTTSTSTSTTSTSTSTTTTSTSSSTSSSTSTSTTTSTTTTL